MKRLCVLVLCGALMACGQTTEEDPGTMCGAGERYSPIEAACVSVEADMPRDMAVTPDVSSDVTPTQDAAEDLPPTQDISPDFGSSSDMSEEDTGPPVLGSLYVGTEPVYTPGNLEVERLDVSLGMMGAPVEAKIWAPRVSGRYAVLVFQHGFLLGNTYYSQVFEHIASHGFVVVAPQMYAPGGLPFGKPSTNEETMAASGFFGWVKTSLGPVTSGRADVSKLGLGGHSRGAKVAWKMMSGGAQGVQALVGVDPVDGTGGPLGGEARVIDGMFSFSPPSLIIGTGKGPESAGGLFSMACAPAGDNHVDFYGASPSPAYHVVATDYGHLDMIDDSPPGCGMACTACVAGQDPAKMRLATGGWIVAHLRAALQGDASATASLGQMAPATATLEQR